MSATPIRMATPMTMASPTGPAAYSWEATIEAVARKYGVPVSRIVRFDVNTSPTSPELVGRILAANTFEVNLSEYPPSDYRLLSEAAAAVYGVEPAEVLVGAGADEVLDITAKAFLAAGKSAVVTIPTYSMYRVVTEQRGASAILVSRLGAGDRYALDIPAIRAAARQADLVWICDPNNPTGLAEAPGTIRTLLGGLAADAAADGRRPPAVVVDEAYAEFSGTSAIPLLDTYPDLVIIRTASKAYALAGLRVGFAIARRATLEKMEPYRPPASVSTVSAAVVTAALLDQEALEENIERIEAQRVRLAADLSAIGWRVGPSVTNFLLVDLGTPERAERTADGMLRRGLVPRTFPQGHPLNVFLRFTVRAPHENDRLITAAREIAAEETAT